VVAGPPALSVLVRSDGQLAAALEAGVPAVYIDYEDIRRFPDAVAACRDPGRPRPAELAVAPPVAVFLATPRVQKPGEAGFFKLVERARPDGVLVRNLGAAAYFGGRDDLVAVGDFGLNVANPLTARHLVAHGLARLTVSYDLDIGQALDLLRACPAGWFELTLHQHMPMFHMEHCVFCVFLSDGHDASDCGRPCEKHRVQLRDRVGQLHTLHADVGCRNTLFRGQAQSAARFFTQLAATGLRQFRVELLNESRAAATRVISTYQRLLAGTATGDETHRHLDAESRLGVVEGTLRQQAPPP
jgi:putative protease